jgi:hypothetical protein
MHDEQLIVLFDEQGTPTFRKDRENELFIGVSVSYKISEEEKIFDQLEKLSGLQNSKPLKNNKISNKRAINIAETLKQLPLFIFVATLNLSNEALIKIVSEYYSVSNNIRINKRKIRERSIAQILHTRLVDNCLFESIILRLENNNNLSSFGVFIDNWSISNEDIQIYLNLRSSSLSKNISALYPGVKISSIELLNRDTKRKRFIDSVTSIISRAFCNKSNEKFTDVPYQILFKNNLNSSMSDITENEILFFNKMLSILPSPG